MDDRQEFVFKSSWPGTTIGGEPGIVDGTMATVIDPDGSVLFSSSIGAPGAEAKDCEYFEFVLSPEQAKELGGILYFWPGQ